MPDDMIDHFEQIQEILKELPTDEEFGKLIEHKSNIEDLLSKSSDAFDLVKDAGTQISNISDLAAKLTFTESKIQRLNDDLSKLSPDDPLYLEIQSQKEVEKSILNENRKDHRNGQAEFWSNYRDAVGSVTQYSLLPNDEFAEETSDLDVAGENLRVLDQRMMSLKLEAEEALKNSSEDIERAFISVEAIFDRVRQQILCNILESASGAEKKSWRFENEAAEPLLVLQEGSAKANDDDQRVGLASIASFRASDFELESRIREFVEHITYDRIVEESDSVTFNSRLEGFVGRIKDHIQSENRTDDIRRNLSCLIDAFKKCQVTSESFADRLGSTRGIRISPNWAASFSEVHSNEVHAAKCLKETVKSYQERLDLVDKQLLGKENVRELKNYCSAVSNEYTIRSAIRPLPLLGAVATVVAAKISIDFVGLSFLSERAFPILLAVFLGAYCLSRWFGMTSRLRAMKKPANSLSNQFNSLLNGRTEERFKSRDPFRFKRIERSSWKSFSPPESLSVNLDFGEFNRWDRWTVGGNGVLVFLFPILALVFGGLVAGGIAHRSPSQEFYASRPDGTLCSVESGLLVYSSFDAYFVSSKSEKNSKESREEKYKENEDDIDIEGGTFWPAAGFFPELDATRVPKSNIVLVETAQSSDDERVNCADAQPVATNDSISDNLDERSAEAVVFEDKARVERAGILSALPRLDSTPPNDLGERMSSLEIAIGGLTEVSMRMERKLRSLSTNTAKVFQVRRIENELDEVRNFGLKLSEDISELNSLLSRIETELDDGGKLGVVASSVDRLEQRTQRILSDVEDHKTTLVELTASGNSIDQSLKALGSFVEEGKGELIERHDSLTDAIAGLKGQMVTSGQLTESINELQASLALLAKSESVDHIESSLNDKFSTGVDAAKAGFDKVEQRLRNLEGYGPVIAGLVSIEKEMRNEFAAALENQKTIRNTLDVLLRKLPNMVDIQKDVDLLLEKTEADREKLLEVSKVVMSAGADREVVVVPNFVVLENDKPQPSTLNILQSVFVPGVPGKIAQDTILLSFLEQKVEVEKGEKDEDVWVQNAFKESFTFDFSSEFEANLFPKLIEAANRKLGNELQLDLRGFASAEWNSLNPDNALKKELNYALAEGRRAAVLERIFGGKDVDDLNVAVKVSADTYRCLDEAMLKGVREFERNASSEWRRFQNFDEMRDGREELVVLEQAEGVEKKEIIGALDHILNRSVTVQLGIVRADEGVCAQNQ